jgi:phage terminase large subunit-like protein
MAWSLACSDWRERLKTGCSLVPKLPLDGAEAERAVAIFNRLRLPDVPGQPTLAEAGGDWFRDIVRALFGSMGEDGKRRIEELFVLVPKKNSKTTNGAALMLTALLLSRRPRGEFLLVAPTQKITELAFNQVIGMIEADPVLNDRIHIQSHLKRVTVRKGPGKGAFLEVKSFDPKIVTGSKACGVLVDELHTVPQSDADRVIGQLKGGLVSQPEAFMAYITTQSERPPSGVFKAKLDQARGIRDGHRGGAMLPVLYEFPEDVDWRDPANWWMVTPNQGLSITTERLVPDYETAIQSGEEELRRWASQHLNIEIGLALRSDRWAGAEFWERRGVKSLTLETVLEQSECVVVGIDGGGLDDLFGLVVLGRDRDTKDWLAWFHAWAHEGVLERRKSIAAKLQDFAGEGSLTIVDDELADISAIVDIVQETQDRGLLACVAVDPAGLGEFVDALAEIGVTEESRLLVGVRQGIGQMTALKTAERRLAAGTLLHDGSRMMAWCVGNLKIEPTATAIRATKQNAGDAKIDPVMALLNAVTMMSRNPVARSSRADISDFLANAVMA